MNWSSGVRFGLVAFVLAAATNSMAAEWRVSTDTDPITDQTIRLALLKSDDDEATLALRCTGSSFDVFVWADDVDLRRGQRYAMTVRTGQAPPIDTWALSTADKSVSIAFPVALPQLANVLRKHERFVVRFGAPAAAATFVFQPDAMASTDPVVGVVDACTIHMGN